MRKTLTYSGFVIASLVVILAFVTATTYTQLAIAVVLYPLLIYFTLKILPRKTWKTPVIAIKLPAKAAKKVEAETVKPKKEGVKIADIDKRAFLKLIGATGISLFLYSIFSKRAQVPFFGTQTAPGSLALEGVSGKKIDPAQSQPMDGYQITEIDDDIVTFYGFCNKSGNWIIMKEDTDAGSFRYVKGDLNFPLGWSNREHLKYGYFHDVFS